MRLQFLLLGHVCCRIENSISVEILFLLMLYFLELMGHFVFVSSNIVRIHLPLCLLRLIFVDSRNSFMLFSLAFLKLLYGLNIPLFVEKKNSHLSQSFWPTFVQGKTLTCQLSKNLGLHEAIWADIYSL